jgi:hypothetical protein
MDETLLNLLVENQEVIVGAVVTGVMWLVTRAWTNVQGSEATKVRQALTVGLMAAAGIIGTNMAAQEPINWWSVAGSAVVAWCISMGIHAGGKRAKGAVKA